MPKKPIYKQWWLWTIIIIVLTVVAFTLSQPESIPDIIPKKDTGLIAHYSFEGSNQTIIDSSKRGNDGIIKGDLERVEGKVGKGLKFDKKRYEHVNINGDDLKFGDGDWTFMTWAKFESLDGFQRITDGGRGGIEISMFTPNVRKLLAIAGEDPNVGAIGIEWRLNIEKDTWYHFALSRKDNDIDFYLDGQLVTEDKQRNREGLMNITSRGINLGGTDQSPSMDGILDEVRIFNEALSQQEIQKIYNEE